MMENNAMEQYKDGQGPFGGVPKNLGEAVHKLLEHDFNFKEVSETCFASVVGQLQADGVTEPRLGQVANLIERYGVVFAPAFLQKMTGAVNSFLVHRELYEAVYEQLKKEGTLHKEPSPPAKSASK